MSSGERPTGAAKGKQSDTEALCQTTPGGGSVSNGLLCGCVLWRCLQAVGGRRCSAVLPLLAVQRNSVSFCADRTPGRGLAPAAGIASRDEGLWLSTRARLVNLVSGGFGWGLRLSVPVIPNT